MDMGMEGLATWLHGSGTSMPLYLSAPNTAPLAQIVWCSVGNKQRLHRQLPAPPISRLARAREVTAEEEEEQRVQRYTRKALALFLQVLYCRVGRWERERVNRIARVNMGLASAGDEGRGAWSCVFSLFVQRSPISGSRKRDEMASEIGRVDGEPLAGLSDASSSGSLVRSRWGAFGGAPLIKARGANQKIGLQVGRATLRSL